MKICTVTKRVVDLQSEAKGTEANKEATNNKSKNNDHDKSQKNPRPIKFV